MLLEKIILKNFRGFSGTHEIPFNKLTTLIGKNDAGKSTIMEALGAFFEHPLCKIDRSDACVRADASNEIRIACVFSSLPDSINLDTSVDTTLPDEYLLNEEGDLEVHKVWQINETKLGPLKTYIHCSHPTTDGVSDLLHKKQAALKTSIRAAGLEDSVNLTVNSEMRQALWRACNDLQLENQFLQVDKEDAKSIRDEIAKHFPTFALFRADRPSTDEDAEVQDPFKVAIQQALSELDTELEAIKTAVRDRAIDVANRTLGKLQEFDSNLASSLDPHFSKALKWDSLFKLSLDSDDGIPINKRGSGVRRLVLFSFFQAEAERLRQESSRHNIIYAVEEPETAQHPDNQKKVIEALNSIAETDGCQVVITTHVPALAGMVPTDGIRYITNTQEGGRSIRPADDTNLPEIANALGIVPDQRAQVIVCVEGPTDIQFLRRISKKLHTEDNSVPDLENDPRIALILLGGSALEHWVNQNLLRNTGLPEVHIYDRDEARADGSYKYQTFADEVNNRQDNSVAYLTSKREVENYLHPSAIEQAFNGQHNTPAIITINNDTDVETELKTLFGQGRIMRRSLKSWLNIEAADAMTVELLEQQGGKEEVLTWLNAIASRMTPLN